jgi:hypothetical protein
MQELESVSLARKIWDYMILDHALEPADCILVFGNNDTRTAKRGAELFFAGYAPRILFSGGIGKDTCWKQTEAEVRFFPSIRCFFFCYPPRKERGKNLSLQ